MGAAYGRMDSISPVTGGPRATLYYASFMEDTIWQAFADIANQTTKSSVITTLVDVCKHVDAAAHEGVSDFPSLVCVSETGRRVVFFSNDDIIASYLRWCKEHDKEVGVAHAANS